MKLISYSLFGYNKERKENCFDFNSYLRGLMINIRLQRLIYPDWTIRLYTDHSTYNGFINLFSKLNIQIRIMPDNTQLCKAMLWRIIPAFEKDIEAVICRDVDSPLTYREAQCVEYWLHREKIIHAITDSKSHNIPLMGGMIGIKPNYFVDRLGSNSWDDFINSMSGYDIKGADQDLLNRMVYPKFASQGSESIVQHYLLGMGNTFLSEWHNSVPNLELPNVPVAMKESNEICGHIGAAGWYETATMKFLHKYWDRFADILEAEKEFNNIFYWTNEKSY
jgi:hypothetical protein